MISGSMVLHVLKFIQTAIRETSWNRITVVKPTDTERNNKFVGSISGQEGAAIVRS